MSRRQARGRRFAGGRGGGSTPPAPWTPASWTGIDSWYRGGVATIDVGVNPWPDLVGTRDLKQAIAGRQPALTAASPNFNGKDVLTFAPGSLTQLLADGPLADLRYLHDGTGAGAAILFRPTSATGDRFLLATSNGTATNTGLELWYSGAQLILQITDSTGTPVVLFISGSILTFNVVHALHLRHKTGETNEWELRLDWVTIASGSYARAPAAGNSTGNLSIGASPTGLYLYGGDVAEIVLAKAYTPADDLVRLADYWSTEYG